GGAGGKIQANVAVTPGQTININVGGMPSCLSCAGWNGGGTGDASSGNTYGSGGGGGASDIRIGGTALNNRVLVAAGGGGGGCYCACCGNGNGGIGGGLTGGQGSHPWNLYYGTGGTQSSGGNGGIVSLPQLAGSLGLGGNADNYGGGGGGGYYGGGAGYQDGGGGGGSSFAGPSASNVIHTSGVSNGNGSVTITYQGMCVSSRVAKTVTVNSIAAPSNPTSNSPQCNAVTITRSGTPPAGVTWYWQGTNSNGTLTSLGSGTTYTATASGNYYIRALNTSGCWSASSGMVAVSVASAPTVPPNPTSNSPQCSSVTLTRSGAPPSGVSWYWQGTDPNGTSISFGSGTTYTASISGTYYIRARNTSGCWSASSGSSNVTISSPIPPPNPTSDSPQCASVTLSRTGSLPAGETWYWQGTNPNGISTTLGSGSNYTATTSGTYFIRARNSIGCWSSSSGSTTVTVSGFPSTPAIPSSNSPNCGSVVLTRNGTPPTGETWYWQGTNSNGTSTSLGSGATFTANSSGTYYIRARNSTGCWSQSSSSIAVTVLENDTSSVDQSACDVFIAPNGSSFLSSGQFQYTLPAVSGCDSIILLDLTVNPSYFVTDSILACQSYTWIDGNTYYANTNSPTYMLTSVFGCDSLVSLSLTLGQPSADTTLIQSTVVGSFELNGTIYTESGLYYQTLQDQYSCDSTVALDLIFESTFLDEVTSDLNFYPNPSKSGLFVVEGIDVDCQMRIFDALGRELKFYFKDAELDLSHLPKGIYLLQVEELDQTHLLRIE
ncbi:MAG: glycine-rich protein, partial [Bacteroidota bacterium]